MRHAYHAGRSGNWESCKGEFRKNGWLSAWASFKVVECYETVEIEEKGRLSITQDILRESMDFPRSILASIGGVTFSYVCPYCHCFPLEDCIWWSPQGTVTATTGRSSATGGVRLVEVSTIGGLRTGFWSYKSARTPRSKSISNTRCTARNLRQFNQLVEALDKPAET